ncbi:30S ribosomal protein S5 [Candidatus Woesearchaeota archaeon]|nr:30S ribosomal protein S5 [Candidatus Woesearchaeota archaeon]
MSEKKSTAKRETEPAELESWQPKTSLGKKVKAGKIKNIDEILDNGDRILEPEIVDTLLPGLESELLLIGQSKGKFGGGQRRVFKQTQKKTCEGNRPQFATLAVVGNKNGYIGISYGKSRETVPAREKAIRKAKLNIIKIRRGCGHWQCSCGEPHTIPYTAKGKAGSIRVRLIPAPRGTGLCAHKEIQKILAFAGIKDVWSKTLGKKNTTTNLIRAAELALRNIMKIKYNNAMKIVEGAFERDIKKEFEEAKEETEKVKEEA